MNKKIIAFALLLVNVFICASESKTEGYETEWLHQSLESAKGDPKAFAAVLYVAASKCSGTLPNKTSNSALKHELDLWEEHKAADRKGLQEQLTHAKLNNPQQVNSIEKEIVKAEQEFDEHDKKIATAISQQKTLTPHKTSSQSALVNLEKAQKYNDLHAIARREQELRRSSPKAKL
jgi:hypothetical protein